MEVLSPGTPNGLASLDSSSSTDPLVVLEHLSEVLQITLGAVRRDLESLGSLLSKSKQVDSLQRSARFASESQVALYAQEDIVEDEATDLNDIDTGEFSEFVLDSPLIPSSLP